MKKWMHLFTIGVAAVLMLSRCGQPADEGIVAIEEQGGANVNQPMERFQALGTALDKMPVQTATATFALG